jgi:hypothetical protein
MARFLPLVIVLGVLASCGPESSPVVSEIGDDLALDKLADPADVMPDTVDVADLFAESMPDLYAPETPEAVEVVDVTDVHSDEGPTNDGPDETTPPDCVQTPSVCDDDNACTVDSCNPILGCVNSPLTGTGCDDADACTLGDICQAGKCVAAETISCIDTDPCTDDLCDPTTGCYHTKNHEICDDGNACTKDDICTAGTCSGTPVTELCNCNDILDCVTLEDGNACNGTLVCLNHQCIVDPATIVICDTSKDPTCKRTFCNAGTGLCGQHDAPDNSGCDDADACTTGDRCLGGSCTGGPPPNCNDGNDCTTDSCAIATGCSSLDNNDVCLAAECVSNVYYAAATCATGTCPVQEVTDCASNKACVTDSCDAATGCSHVVKPNYCLIDGACVLEGATFPTDPCRVCTALISFSDWTVAGDGSSCGAGRACLDGRCLGPLITEFMAVNRDTTKDEDGDTSDWIEIYNPAGVPLSLLGYHLTDDKARPGKWIFPDVSIPPNAYLVVFASGKNRMDPAGVLHTNFKLGSEGEYLALSSPNYLVVQEFPIFPAQAPDVSYGIAVSVARAPFVTTGNSARYFVALGANPPFDWAGSAFDDTGTGWETGLTGIGFDFPSQYQPPASGDALGTPIADSVADWSTTGIQGANGWTYGYYDRTNDPDHVYSADAFIPFPHDGSGFGPTDFWTGSSYEWFQGDPPWTAIGSESVHPNGENNISEHWVIRRYTTEIAGPLVVEWHIGRNNLNGDGVTGYVFHQGTLVDSIAIAGSDSVGATRLLVLPEVMIGDTIDFALGPTGPGGQPEDWSDGSVLTSAVWPMPNLESQIATSVDATMFGVTPGMYVRIAFDNESPVPLNRLWLRMKYNDGFLAYLNGSAIASANAPEIPTWNATATANRSVAAAQEFEIFDARSNINLLAAGRNTLAIHGFNVAADSPTFLVLPELEGRLVTYDAASVRYYSKPTPGADNDDATGTLGPIMEHLTPAGSAASGQEIVVSTRAFPTSAEVAGAVLIYRVMFGPEVSVPMTDAGNGIFSAAIPADVAAPGQMVRWYILGSDVNGQTGRTPIFPDPLDSEQYFGTIIDDPTIVSNLPVIHWFIENPAAANTRTGTRSSLFFAGEFYDNVKFNLHGQSTSGSSFPKKSYNVDFNSDHRFRLSTDFRRMKDIKLLTNYADKSKLRNTLGYETFRNAGSAYHLAFPIRVQRNGTFFSVQDFVEDADDRWLERLGLDPENALYKQYDGLYNAALGEKKTREYEDNSDLASFIANLDLTGDALRNFIYDNVNLAAMANFYAGLTITSDKDCCHKNFYAYRDTNGTGEWWYLPWDLDLTFGRNWIQSVNYFDDNLYPQNRLFGGGGNKLTSILYAMPEFSQMYVRRLRTLMDQLQQPPETPQADLKFEKRIDELVTLIGADGAADYAAWPKWGLDQTMEQAAGLMKTNYMAPRRVFLFETKTADGTIPSAQEHPIILFGEFDLSPERPDEAYFTLDNQNAFAVDLSGWQVSGDISITLKPGTVIPALGTLVVSPDVVTFRKRALPPTGGQGLFVQGNYVGVISQFESLTLLDDAGNTVSWAL